MNSKVVIRLVVLFLLIGAAATFIFGGFYNIGADAPHTTIVTSALDELREKSISRHAAGVEVPADLGDAKRIAAGAGLYNEMCTGCHLGPGIDKTELSQGIYPEAPELAKGDDLSTAEQFWVIKHGVKLTAMPAWGKTHNDQLIWDMVAFIRAMPKMSPKQYRATVASAPEDHDEMMEHAGGH